jgi:hypothetical protein
MRIGLSIDQLRIHPDPVVRALHAALEHVRNPKRFADLAQIPFDPALIVHHRTAADHAQVRDLGQISENFVLDAIGKISVLLFIA